MRDLIDCVFGASQPQRAKKRLQDREKRKEKKEQDHQHISKPTPPPSPLFFSLFNPQMDTPPPNSQPSSEPRPRPLPLTSPLRTYPKRGLPPSFASTYPHGLISGHARTPSQQARLAARTAEILRTMGTGAAIERGYEEVVGRIRREVEEGERRGREVEGEVEKLRMEREMERRVWGKLREGREG